MRQERITFVSVCVLHSMAWHENEQTILTLILLLSLTCVYPPSSLLPAVPSGQPRTYQRPEDKEDIQVFTG